MTVIRGENPWITPRRAGSLLGVSEMSVYKLAVIGKVRTLIEPGENVRINREDVERLAKERGRTIPTAV